MTSRRAAALAVLVALSTLTFASASTARPPSSPATLDADDFQQIVLAAPTDGSPLPSFDLGRPASPMPLEDFTEEARSFEPRADAPQPVKPQSILKPTPKPKPPVTSTAGGGSGGARYTKSGVASWYCKAGVSACHYQYSSGMYAAAGPALRVGNWRGRTVTVCSGSRCVNVKLVDWCQCYGSRVIDLYSDAFSRLGSLSEGTIPVTVSWR